jgi:hypothetical protein
MPRATGLVSPSNEVQRIEEGMEMSGSLESWPRPHYERPGRRPFLFYVIFGGFDAIPEIDSQEYRTLGVHPGLELGHYNRQDHAEVLSGFRSGYLWDELAAQDQALARRIAESDQCLILRGELEDRGDLNYLRDSVGLLTFFLDHGGICVYDPQMFRWWEPGAWRRQVFQPAGPVPRQHVVILTSDEDESGAPGEPRTWFHTRGMRKFGRPDLSAHDVPPQYHEAVIDLFERFIEFQALGGFIAEGQAIRMRSLPPGMTCHHRGDLDDPDFNNVHVEITPPRSV